jgi:hypothetical protein
MKKLLLSQRLGIQLFTLTQSTYSFLLITGTPNNTKPLFHTFVVSILYLLEPTSSSEIGIVTFPHQKQILIVTSFHAYGLETVIDSVAVCTF